MSGQTDGQLERPLAISRSNLARRPLKSSNARHESNALRRRDETAHQYLGMSTEQLVYLS